MRRYRIKIVTYKNNRKEYTPQLKTRMGWICLDYEGKPNVSIPLDSREKALKRIDMHNEGNANKQSIEFEYITK